MGCEGWGVGVPGCSWDSDAEGLMVRGGGGGPVVEVVCPLLHVWLQCLFSCIVPHYQDIHVR